MTRSPCLGADRQGHPDLRAATISEEWLEITSGSVQAKFLEVVRQGRVRDPQLCSNSSLGSSVLEGDVPQFIAEAFQVDSSSARISTTFIAQAWGSNASVLLLLVSFPHGRNLLARAKILTVSLEDPKNDAKKRLKKK